MKWQLGDSKPMHGYQMRSSECRKSFIICYFSFMSNNVREFARSLDLLEELHCQELRSLFQVEGSGSVLRLEEHTSTEIESRSKYRDEKDGYLGSCFGIEVMTGSEDTIRRSIFIFI